MHWTRIGVPPQRILGKADNPIRASIDALARKAAARASKLDAFKGRITVMPGATNDRAVIRQAVAGCDGVLTRQNGQVGLDDPLTPPAAVAIVDAALRARLEASGIPCRVYVGMRCWTPLLADTLARMANEGVRHALALVLVFVGSKILLVDLVGKIPAAVKEHAYPAKISAALFPTTWWATVSRPRWAIPRMISRQPLPETWRTTASSMGMMTSAPSTEKRV